ncbi:MAG: hypothetical protein RBT49_08425 [Bacteroidales bacterium]|jgi:hypothetical protein|nr:hypothetical protein [Bacteroidales bacterium]
MKEIRGIISGGWRIRIKKVSGWETFGETKTEEEANYVAKVLEKRGENVKVLPPKKFKETKKRGWNFYH